MMDWRYLFSEDKENFSLGRIAFWIALGYSSYFWFFTTAPFPHALLEFLYSALAYNLMKKGVNAYTVTRTSTGTSMGLYGAGNIIQQVKQPINQPGPPINTTTIISQQDVSDEDLKTTKPPAGS
jgi:hypothetical protein